MMMFIKLNKSQCPMCLSIIVKSSPHMLFIYFEHICVACSKVHYYFILKHAILINLWNINFVFIACCILCILVFKY